MRARSSSRAAPRFWTLSVVLHILLNAAHAAIPESEKAALRMYYTALGGGGWDDRSGWTGLFNESEYKDPCEHPGTWHLGVYSCSYDNTSITGLALFGVDHNVTGTLPTEASFFLNLANLTTFVLADQPGLSGTIPEGFFCGDFTCAEVLSGLYLYNLPRLSGVLPSNECLSRRSNRTQLATFYAYETSLSGTLPSGLLCGNAAAASLQDLDVSSNKLSGYLPSEQCLASRPSTAQLRFLLVYENRLSGTLPSGFVCGTPASAALYDLEVSYNSISGALPSGRCLNSRPARSQLETFAAQNNVLSGTLPSGFVCGSAVAEKMQEFDVAANGLSGTMPSEECLADRSAAAQLRLFYAQVNSISGTLPSGFVCGNAAAAALQVFEADRNLISGTLPSESCLMERPGASGLRFYDVAYNEVSGTIPPSFMCRNEAARRMGHLDLKGNMLSGFLPPESCFAARSNASVLSWLNVSGNRLSGVFPHGLLCGNRPAIEAMETLYIDDNAISGELPSEQCLASRWVYPSPSSSSSSSPALAEFSAGSSRISGVLHPSLLCGGGGGGGSNRLRSLKLSNCKISGALPSCGGGARSNITVFEVHTNRLEGTLPDFTAWNMLQVLSVSSNPKLSGPLGHLPPSLKYIVAQGTKLDGYVDALSLPPNLRKAYLSGNRLSGTISGHVFRPNLEELALSHNRISGTIPRAIGTSGNLTTLLLDSNRISGTLPEELANVLPLVRTLRLDLNEISCGLPAPLQARGAWPSRGGAEIRVLQGNVFGCEGLEGLMRADRDGDSYVCGNDGFIVPFVLLMAFGVVALLLGLVSWCAAPTIRECAFSLSSTLCGWWFESRTPLQRAARNSVGVALAMIVMAVLSTAVAIPVFSEAQSSVQCQ
eukprot:jgi/Bigna1/142025/aug1.66_g16733